MAAEIVGLNKKNQFQTHKNPLETITCSWSDVRPTWKSQIYWILSGEVARWIPRWHYTWVCRGEFCQKIVFIFQICHPALPSLAALVLKSWLPSLSSFGSFFDYYYFFLLKTPMAHLCSVDRLWVSPTPSFPVSLLLKTSLAVSMKMTHRWVFISDLQTEISIFVLWHLLVDTDRGAQAWRFLEKITSLSAVSKKCLFNGAPCVGAGKGWCPLWIPHPRSLQTFCFFLPDTPVKWKLLFELFRLDSWVIFPSGFKKHRLALWRIFFQAVPLAPCSSFLRLQLLPLIRDNAFLSPFRLSGGNNQPWKWMSLIWPLPWMWQWQRQLIACAGGGHPTGLHFQLWLRSLRLRNGKQWRRRGEHFTFEWEDGDMWQ